MSKRLSETLYTYNNGDAKKWAVYCKGLDTASTSDAVIAAVRSLEDELKRVKGERDEAERARVAAIQKLNPLWARAANAEGEGEGGCQAGGKEMKRRIKVNRHEWSLSNVLADPANPGSGLVWFYECKWCSCRVETPWQASQLKLCRGGLLG